MGDPSMLRFVPAESPTHPTRSIEECRHLRVCLTLLASHPSWGGSYMSSVCATNHD
ncbi:hypothetical protein M378DRAFT_357022 [Amanita muscaria Koide BX008]|uniref:Uncharacterized protein n=1 Tax=Amanita muscaria (strain Koide BX008) TaxID=946122 RepID=A0A0C2WNR5_AMAMK|nr:hypothetical protein M378DRAFT_357022 [Amanita muscaria Koide BX008]